MKGLFIPPGRHVWMFRYWNGVRQVRESMGTKDEAEAVAKATQILLGPKLQKTENYAEELRRYFEIQRQADRLSRQSVEARSPVLKKFFQDVERQIVGEVKTTDIQKWYDSLTCKEDTRQTYVRWIRAFYKNLVERGRLRGNPCVGVKMGRLRPAARRSTIAKKEVAKLIEECRDPSLKFVLLCGFHAGMRKGEVIEARPEWFDTETGHIHIGPTPTWIPKDRERRSVPLSKLFKAFLRDYGKPSPYMLAPDVRPGKSVYRYDFERAYKAHIKACGVECTFHDARRTFASQLVSAGMSVYKVAKYLGDGVGVVEKHYGHLQKDDGEFARMMR